MNAKSEKPKRLFGGKNSEASQKRYKLYAAANNQIKAAFEAGFYIECVSICESIIGDRIEARIQFIKHDDTKRHFVDAVGNRLTYLRSIEVENDPNLSALYNEITLWTRKRNEVIHQFVKVTDANHELSAEQRTALSKEAAEQGRDIMRRLSAFVRKLNDWEGRLKTL